MVSTRASVAAEQTTSSRAKLAVPIVIAQEGVRVGIRFVGPLAQSLRFLLCFSAFHRLLLSPPLLEIIRAFP